METRTRTKPNQNFSEKFSQKIRRSRPPPRRSRAELFRFNSLFFKMEE